MSKVRSRAIDEARKVALDYLKPDESANDEEIPFSALDRDGSANNDPWPVPFEDGIEDERLVEERNPTLQAVWQQATPTQRKILNALKARLSKSGYLSQHGLAEAVARDLDMAPETVRVHRMRLRRLFERLQKTLPVQEPDKPDDQLKFEDYDRMMRETPCLQLGTRLVPGRRFKLSLTEALLQKIALEAEAEVRLGLMLCTRRIPTADELDRWEEAKWERGKDDKHLMGEKGLQPIATPPPKLASKIEE